MSDTPLDQCAENTDREIYRGPDDGCGDYYSDSLHVTKEGALGINCGGYVIVKPIRTWHNLAKELADARAERDAAVKDAERWQEIRGQFSPLGLNIDGNHAWIWRGSPSRLKGSNMDAAIDAAIAARKP